MEWFPDFIGIIGVILVLFAYLLLQANKYAPSDLQYLALNMVGSVFLLFSLYFNWNLSSVIIEIVWFMITLWGVCKYLRQNKVSEPQVSA